MEQVLSAPICMQIQCIFANSQERELQGVQHRIGSYLKMQKQQICACRVIAKKLVCQFGCTRSRQIGYSVIFSECSGKTFATKSLFTKSFKSTFACTTFQTFATTPNWFLQFYFEFCVRLQRPFMTATLTGVNVACNVSVCGWGFGRLWL